MASHRARARGSRGAGGPGTGWAGATIAAVPVYEFRCGDCGESFDRLLPFGAAEPPCPTCGSPNVRRLISVIAGLAGSGSGSGSSGGCACGGACTCRR